MRKFISFIFILLSIATGALFIYSAYTKATSLPGFEYTLVEYIHLPWFVAAMAARFFIGLETALGALLILHFYGKNSWVAKVSFFLLAIFSLYIIYLWHIAGSNVNCGCFGDKIWLTPAQSLVKNGIMLVALGLLLFRHRGWQNKVTNVSAVILLLGIISLPYMLYPTDWMHNGRYKLDLSSLYVLGKTDKPTTDLNKGKYIISFLSQSCPHCRKAASAMHAMKQQNPALPFFFIIGGTSDLKDFWEATKATDIPYCRMDKDNFLKATGGVFPRIFWVQNDTVEASSTYISLNQQAIEAWIKK